MKNRTNTRRCGRPYNGLSAKTLILAGFAVIISLGISSLALHTRPAATQELDKNIPILTGDGSLVEAMASLERDELSDAPQVQTKVTANDGAANDRFGTSVAISGGTAVVGSPDDDGANNNQGSAYVFVQGGAGSWTLQQKLVASDAAASERFGSSVAISGDTIMVSPNQQTTSITRKVYVFVRSGTTWSEQQVLTLGSSGDVAPITSLALSGNTAVAGMSAGTAMDPGEAFVLFRSETIWTIQQRLTPNDGADGDGFGQGVGISGEMVVVGAPNANIGSNSRQGAVYIFARSVGFWTQREKLTPTDGTADFLFGTTAAISNGTVIARGGGVAVYVFVLNGFTWTQQEKLMVSGSGNFGINLDIENDTIVVGASSTRVGSNSGQGSGYVFARCDEVWTLAETLVASDGAAQDFFGADVAISGDKALVGANLDDVGATNQGSAYFFQPVGVPCETEIVVNITTDQPDADLEDDVCDADIGQSGNQCSLRAAIQTANAKDGPDDIKFDIPGAGPHSISPLTQLPSFTETVTIDATTQPGYTSSPLIELVGTSTTGGLGFFGAGSGNSTVRGFAINRFAVAIGLSSGGNRVEKCYIGLSPNGTAAGAPDAQQIGISIQTAAATNNTVGGPGASNNVISNNLFGVAISQGATGNSIVSNRIGTNPAGTTAIPNLAAGVLIDGSSNNTIGGATAAPSNLISGNATSGVLLQNNATNNVVAGNLIGTNFDGTEAIPNAVGVNLVDSDNNRIGTDGTEGAANGNVLSGNSAVGIYLQTNSSNNLIAGNKVGTRSSGTLVLGNGQHGIFLATGSAGNNIKFNVIGGHDQTNESGGVVIGVDAAAGNTVTENSIGVTANGGTVSLANKYGIVVFADGQTVGQSGAGNYVSHNQKAGIWVSSIPGGPNPVVENVTITGNRVGTNGSADIGNAEFGIWLSGNVTECTVTGNYVGGNDVAGIALTDGAESNQITSNFVGVNVGLTSGIPNTFGIWIRQANDNTVSENVVGGNIIGMLIGTNIGFGTSSPIAGTYRANLDMALTNGGNYTTANRIFGNIVGLGTGLIPIPNKTGIAVGENARSNFIGTSNGAPNIISGNTDAPGYGILLGTLTSNPPEDTLPRQNTFVKNRIGLGPNLTTISNTKGFVLVQAVQNTIGGDTDDLANIIVASSEEGISLLDGTRDNILLKNYLGVLPTGLGSRVNGSPSLAPGGGTYGNGSHGIVIRNGASGNTLRNNAVGGNGGNGITISGSTTANNLLYGNTIGGAMGSRPLVRRMRGAASNGNAGHGIFIDDATNTRIGETTAGQGNRIIENGLDGIRVQSTAASLNAQLLVNGNDVSFNLGNGVITTGAHESLHVMQGNRVTDNGESGMVVASSNNNSITQNVVSNNDEEGVVLMATATARNNVRGNTISANGSHGVFITEGANTNNIGGPAQGQGNTINNNGGAGIHLTATAGNGNNLDPNLIFGNVGPGIDIGGDGFTPNDPTDADVGPNKLQNYPTMTLSLVGGDLIVSYQVDSAPQHSSYGSTGIYVEFFEADSTGAGRDFLGSDHFLLSDYTNGTPGTRQKNLGNAAALGIVAGDLLTATATDAEGNSSEFAPTVIAPSGAPGFEADVAPRPNGDGNMLSTDITQMRRFVSGLDTPNPATNEAQRIDCAPRSTFGDGIVNSSDVVQGRRYVSGLDVITPAGGPASRVGSVPESIFVPNRDSGVDLFQRELSIGEPEFRRSTVIVPIELTSQGNEVAMSFTVEYDPSVLANPRITLGKFAPAGSTLTVNTTEPGRIGILIDSTNAMTASAMPQQLLAVTFELTAGGRAAEITLSGSVAAQGMSDSSGNSLVVRYQGGLVKLPAN